MAENSFQNTVEALFKGMDSFITTKTVVGDAITIGDTIILPLVDVSFGVGAGAFAEGNKNNGAGGMGGKISPSAVLVINKNGTKLVNVKNQMQSPRSSTWFRIWQINLQEKTRTMRIPPTRSSIY